MVDATSAQLSRYEPAALMWHHMLHPFLTLVAACLLLINQLHSAAAIVSCYPRGPMCHVADAISVPCSPSDGCRSVLDYSMTVLSVCLCAVHKDWQAGRRLLFLACSYHC